MTDQNDHEQTRVKLHTSMGEVLLILYPKKAPMTVDNFLHYVKDGFYSNTLFHRVIDHFIIQGGGFESGMIQKTTRAPIQNESKNGLLNQRGTVAMARLPRDPHSATAQFFINTRDNDILDYSSNTETGWGYCVFGLVVEGMEVIERIEGVPTRTIGEHQDVPIKEILIERVDLV